MPGKLVMVGGLIVVAVAGGLTTAVLGGGRDAAPRFPLLGDDYGRLRREALIMFPRGTAVPEVTEALTAMGFLCAPTRRLTPNINAPAVQCDSAGRGYPSTARMSITVLARNGALSDIAIGNGIDDSEADARTPNPPPLHAAASAAAGTTAEGAPRRPEGE